jgi:hypothetical protein
MPSIFTIFVYVYRMKWVLILSGLLLLVLGEVYLRLPFIPQRLESVPDEELGGILAPSQRGYDWLGNFSVQSVPITVNSDGHRGHDTDWSAPVLLAVGDSQGWGTGVADNEVYTAVLETHLREQPGQGRVQVVNASGPGFGPHQQLVMLRRVLAKHSVSGVLVRVSIEDRMFEPLAGEDLERAVKAARRRFAIRRVTKFLPHLWVKAQVQLPSMRTALKPWFLRSSGSGATQFTPEIGQKMWTDNKAHWQEMASLAAASGIPAVFFLYDPQADQASAALWERMQDLPVQYRNCHLVRLGPESFHLDEHKYVDLTLEESTGDPHANAEQNRFIAEALFDYLKKERLAPGARDSLSE